MKVPSTSVTSRINMEEIHKPCSSAQWNKKVVEGCMYEREGRRERERERGGEGGREREGGGGDREVDGVNNVNE